jgi:hypothetical protein
LAQIFWLSAFAAVLSWNNAGIEKGAEEKKIPKSEGNCTTFAFGSEKKCKLSYTASSFGIIILYVLAIVQNMPWIVTNRLGSVLFLITAGISIFYTVKVKKNPQLDDPWLSPESSQTYKPTAMGDAENGQSKDPIWDTNTQDLDGHHDNDSDDGRLGGGHGYGGETDHGHPGRPVNWGGQGPFDDSYAAPAYNDTEYRGTGNYQPPSAMSPTDAYSPQHRDQQAYGSSQSRQGGGRYSFSAPHADA